MMVYQASEKNRITVEKGDLCTKFVFVVSQIKIKFINNKRLSEHMLSKQLRKILTPWRRNEVNLKKGYKKILTYTHRSLCSTFEHV